MRRNAVIVFLFTLMSLSLLFGQEKYKDYWDGSDWEKLDVFGKDGETIKVIYLVAFKQGRRNGMDFVWVDLSSRGKDYIEKNREVIKSIMQIRYSDDFVTGAPGDQIIKGIDEFYRDYANKSIPVFLLANLARKRINGEISQEGVEKELMRLRSIKY